MNIRNAVSKDAKGMFYVEGVCFTEAEAASLEAIEERIELFSDICYVCEDKGEIVGFINGAISKCDRITDDFFEKMSKDDGDNVLIFSLGVHPDHQRKGYGRELLNQLIEQSKLLNKKQIVLTCKEHKIPYYGSFGFVNEGLADSDHGGSKWYTMTIKI